MTSPVIGMEESEARRLLEQAGFAVTRVEYASPRGVLEADSVRVIRVRELAGHQVEITVSGFKTKV
jgi:hypothetical protein